MHSRTIPLVAAILIFVTRALVAQAMPDDLAPAPSVENGLYLTGFRSPSTGLEFRLGSFGLHGGWYPTILEADGQNEGQNTNFIRIGVSAFLRSRGVTPYVAPALLLSLDDDWGNGVLSEAGVRVPVTRGFSLRGGVGVLTTFSGEVRVNPTIGFDLRVGRL
ncbi:MAG: hypothetical protein SFU84_06860 [Gemmatimonadales bacterium]|nr:hypothetical protein [Gemmatimonadales bacterium]